ncbi:MAG: ferritin, partial [Armatimonadota bacterium]|nr:ferritin [Armatimonadota bacterium]
MLGKTLQDALNKQINAEAYSSYLYLAMSAHCEANNLPGMAKWLRVQAEEEKGHAMRLFDYVNERGGRVVLEAIPQPPVEYASPVALFEQVLAHEQKITASIHELY